jgi:hypothetical protein
LNQCSLEPRAWKLAGEREHLALDETNTFLTSPT